MASRFRDTELYAYLSYDLDLSGSCDVIGHVTIRFPIGHFLVDSSGSFDIRRAV